MSKKTPRRKPGQTKLGDRIEKFLRGVDTGEIPLTLTNPDPDTGGPGFCGYPAYVSPDGWRVCVFDDCLEWDYLEWIETPQGQRVKYPSWESRTHHDLIVRGYGPACERHWGYDHCPNPSEHPHHKETPVLKRAWKAWRKIAQAA